eukprot:CAMPEP_0178869040 /NCGR_PEP_ID=MMETSP0747-20121128/6324_1 /TAXON_ID=913974 /ORGANISM="Nitzschia punctata, Strain CCMP561" /LENGTH=76 /DNA_ID=CAMNT_0020536053 /DNA_START=230 /DNA_END=460 /DNA_ORIENTATION=-
MTLQPFRNASTTRCAMAAPVFGSYMMSAATTKSKSLGSGVWKSQMSNSPTSIRDGDAACCVKLVAAYCVKDNARGS